jgi:hypothetical protein
MSLKVILASIEAGLPVLTTGPPGTGKTGWFKTLEKQRNYHVIPVTASVREPVDIGGWPFRTDDGIKLEPGAWAVEAMRVADTEDEHGNPRIVVVFFDELRTVTAPMQAALLKVVHEGLVGDTFLPSSVRFAAAANSVEDSAGGVPLEPPMANRFVHVKWELPPMQWVEAMNVNEYTPQSNLSKDALSRLGQARAFVASFIHKRPELLLSMPQDEEHRDGPWPSPRTWDYAAHLWASSPDIDKGELLAACVGLPAAGEFMQWQEHFDLPTPEEALAGKVPDSRLVDQTRPDRTYAILSSCVSLVAGDWTPERYTQAWEVLAKVADLGQADVAAAMVSSLTRTTIGQKHKPDITKKLAPFVDLLQRAGIQIGVQA